MADFASMLTWRNDSGPTPQSGPGVSRAQDGAKTKRFRLKVYIPGGGMPFFLTFQAESEAKARRYTQARWPNCRVLSCEKV